MSTPYRGEMSFEIARGARAMAEMRRAAHPWPLGWDVVVAVALVASLGVVVRGAWHEPTAWVLPGFLLFAAWTMARQTRRTAVASAPPNRVTTGTFDDEGVRIEANSGSFALWSWDRITSARRTKTALALFTDAELGIVILAENVPNLDRLADFATARARAPRRSPSRWMVVLLSAYVALTCIALRPRPLATPHERIDDALDRHDEPAQGDIDALGEGTLCERVELADLLASHYRADLSPAYYDDERATVMVAQDLEVCAEGAIVPRGRVVLDDTVLGVCTYYVFTRRDHEGFVLAGPYGFFAEQTWTRVEPGALDVDLAIRAASALHGRLTMRTPASPPRFDLALRDEDDDGW